MDEIAFEEFAAVDLVPWLEQQRSGYISERMAAGETQAEAEANAEASMGRLFPGGSPAPGQLVGWILHRGDHVGQLWVGPFGDDPRRWWVWDVAIDKERRGQGLGRGAMILAEGLAAAHGATSIGLNVFAHNQVARRLYQSLGYEESAVQMRKELSPEAPGGHAAKN